MRAFVLSSIAILLVGCGQAPPPTGVVILHEADFDQRVLQADYVSLVKFTMPNCAVCKQMEPIVATIATDYAGEILVGTVDLFDDGPVAMRYDIDVTPTLVVFADGAPVARFPGASSAATLRAAIDRARTP